jgi:hypothetical protein
MEKAYLSVLTFAHLCTCPVAEKVSQAKLLGLPSLAIASQPGKHPALIS